MGDAAWSGKSPRSLSYPSVPRSHWRSSEADWNPLRRKMPAPHRFRHIDSYTQEAAVSSVPVSSSLLLPVFQTRFCPLFRTVVRIFIQIRRDLLTHLLIAQTGGFADSADLLMFRIDPQPSLQFADLRLHRTVAGRPLFQTALQGIPPYRLIPDPDGCSVLKNDPLKTLLLFQAAEHTEHECRTAFLHINLLR